jgi:hypothetical protein
MANRGRWSPHQQSAASIAALTMMNGNTHSLDSAEKPPMVKKEQVKTQPKQSNHSKRIAFNQTWTFLYLTRFWCFGWFIQKGWVLSRISNLAFQPPRGVSGSKTAAGTGHP